MDNYSILGIASFVVILFALVFAIFLFTVKSETKLSNRILGLMLVLTAIDLSSFFYHRFIDMPLALEMIRIDLSILSLPMLFFYILSLIYKDFKFRKIHLIHLLPWILSFVFMFPRFYSQDLTGRQDFFNNYLYNPEVIFIIWMSYAVSFAYKIYIYYILARGKKIMLENYSNLERTNFKWVFQLNTFSLVMLIFVLIKQVSKYVIDDFQTLNIIRIIVVVLVLSFTCWLILTALYRPEIFRGIESSQKTVKDILGDQVSEGESDHQVDPKIERVKAYVEEHRPYLDPQLTIQSLAHQVEMPVTELSVLINHKMGKHFFDFTNEYRIEEAKKLLKIEADQKLTVLEILYKVGFNSKSSFNTAFKKYTSMTPTQFRKSTVN